jgi:4-amino-4-deoxy-L-arabinose transferase-like glycosyltransferase
MVLTRQSAVAVPEVVDSKQMYQKRPRYQHLPLLAPILLVYFCLAFYRIDHQSLWVDELFSLRRANPEGVFLERPGWFAGHGPLYFRTLQLWARWGTGEFPLRALSTLFGGVAVCLAYALGLRLYNRRVACIGALLLATSPFFIWYSQEVRYVMLMMATALFAMYTFHVALTTKRINWWLLHCCSLILAIGVFVVNIFLPMAQGLYLLSSPTRRSLFRPWVACQSVVFVLFVWWANYGYITELGGYWQRLFVHVTSSPETRASIDPTERLVTGSTRDFTAMGLPYTFFVFSTGYSLGPSMRELQISRSVGTLLPHAPIIVLCVLLFGSLFLLGLVALRRQPDTARFLVSWLVVPVMGTLAISALIPEMAYNVRYVAMSFPAYILILAVGIAGFRRRLLQAALLVAVLMVSSLSLANYYFNPSYSREDTRSAAQYMTTVADANDAIVLVGSGYVFKHYYKQGLPIFILSKALINDRVALANRLEELSKDHDHLWLVSIRPWRVDPKGIVPAMLNDRYTAVGRQELTGVEVYSYQLR